MRAELPDFLVTDDEVAPPGAVRVKRAPSANHTPGEPGLWIFILGDMTLFGAFFIALMWEKRQFSTVFQPRPLNSTGRSVPRTHWYCS
jgi:nitric oxide reductase NorE protein